MKILYVTTIGSTMAFFKAIIRELIEEGNTVDIATNNHTSEVPEVFSELGCRIFDISTSRSPFSCGNLRAIGQIRKLAADYDIVHCHTPLAAAATRLACRRLRKEGLKVVYTAHGFHFYKGAPLKNWLFYYPIERLCSGWTDVLITINKEDYKLARKKMKPRKIEYVPGVGIDIKKFSDAVTDKEKKREELGVPKDAEMILSVGELNRNKNHRIVIKALGKINDNNIHYVIAGNGNQKEKLLKLAAECGVNLHLLGFRDDVAQLYKACDLFVLPSVREGLNVSAMEAMAAGCPVIASDIRGNNDMVPAENCFDPFSADDVAEKILKKEIKNGDFINGIDYSVINRRIKEIYSDLAGTAK